MRSFFTPQQSVPVQQQSMARAVITCALLALCTLLVVCPCCDARALPPNHQQIAPTVTVNGRVQLLYPAPRQYKNPFNQSQAHVLATFHTPAGATVQVDGFWFQNYSRALVDNKEVLSMVGEACWCVRFAPQQTGSYSFTVTLRDATGTSPLGSGQFDAVPASAFGIAPEPPSLGFVRVAPNGQHFAEERPEEEEEEEAEEEAGTGTSSSAWFPVGENVCWTNATGSYAWGNYFDRIASYGGNYARLWLTDEYLGDLLAIQTVRL